MIKRWYYPLRWLLLISLGLAIYGQTFGYNFVFDDNYYILDTSYIRNFDHINQIWASVSPTRLIGVYSLALNYSIGQLHPQGYHIFNFIVHLLTVGLVWATASVLFKIVGVVEENLPFIIALLFLVHPCQTQAVSYISQRFESMAALFYLASIYFYLRGRTASKAAHKNFLVICSIIFAILGIFTKETAVTIPLMMLAIEFILLNRKPLKKKKLPSRQFYWRIAVLGFLFILLFMKIVRTDFISEYFNFTAPSASHDGDIVTGSKYVLTQMRVLLTFLRVLVFPINQNVDYDYPLSTGLLSPPLTLVGLCVISFMVYLIFRLRQQWPLIAFGLAWILITFSINTAPRINLIFEHKLYLISFGFFLVTVVALSHIIKNRKVLFGVLILFIAVLSLVSYKRNQVWKDELTLWRDVVQKSPHKARPYNGLGVSLGMMGNFTEAIPDFNKAITLKPDYAEAYNNRGNTYFRQGNLPQALSDLNKAIELNPNYIEAYTNRGSVNEAQGDLLQAKSDYSKVIALDPNQVGAYYSRGRIFAKEGDFTRAIADFNNVILIDPTDTEAYLNRGTFYAQQGSLTQALLNYNQAIEINPDFKEIYYNRAVTYYQLKEYTRAWEDVAKAQELGALVNPHFINDLKRASSK